MAKKQADFERLRYGASLGLNLGQLAGFLGMSRKTFDRRRKENGEIAAAKLFLQSKAGWSSKTQLEIKDDSPKLNIYLQTQIGSDSLKTIEAGVIDESSENKTGLNITLI